MGDVGFHGEVHMKTPGLYHVPNWSYGQKTQKKGGNGGFKGGPGGLSVGRGAGEMQGFSVEVHEKTPGL